MNLTEHLTKIYDRLNNDPSNIKLKSYPVYRLRAYQDNNNTTHYYLGEQVTSIVIPEDTTTKFGSSLQYFYDVYVNYPELNQMFVCYDQLDTPQVKQEYRYLLDGRSGYEGYLKYIDNNDNTLLVPLTELNSGLNALVLFWHQQEE